MPEGRYLYCIAPADREPPPHLEGVRGGAVRSEPSGELALWLSELDTRPAPSVERIRRHDAVVQAAMTDGTTAVPVRFGQWFACRDALVAAVDGERERYEALLRRLAGRCEVGVRILGGAPAAVAAATGPSPDGGAGGSSASGRAYMARLARRERRDEAVRQRGRALAEELEDRLDGLAGDRRVAILDPPDGLVSVAHLVDRDEAARYRDAVKRFAAAHPDLDVHVTGPWPPYSFV